MKIYSEPGQDTTVKMYLPRLMPAEAPAEIPAQPGAIPGGSKAEVILVVEDKADVRESTVGMLEELGCAVLEAGDGAPTLRLLADHPEIRLLFTVGLPGGINGRQLAKQARAMRPDIKVPYTTGYACNAIVHNGILDPASSSRSSRSLCRAGRQDPHHAPASYPAIQLRPYDDALHLGQKRRPARGPGIALKRHHCQSQLPHPLAFCASFTPAHIIAIDKLLCRGGKYGGSRVIAGGAGTGPSHCVGQEVGTSGPLTQ